MIKTFRTSQKVFVCIMEKKTVKIRRISTVSLIHHTTRTKVSKHLCPNFAWLRIFRDFARIFDKSKLLGVRLYHPASPPPTPLSKLALRSSIETPLLLFMVWNTGTQQTCSKWPCSRLLLLKKSKNCQIILQTPNACSNLQIFYACQCGFYSSPGAKCWINFATNSVFPQLVGPATTHVNGWCWHSKTTSDKADR